MKKIISLIIALSLVIGMMPVSVFAAGVQTISFAAAQTGTVTPLTADYDTCGWEADVDGTGTWLTSDKWTTTTYLNDKSGLYVYLKNALSGNNAAVNVRVNETGWYDIQATLAQISADYNGKISVYIDGAYAGQLLISKGLKKLRPLYLTEGKHSVFFCYDEGVNGKLTDARMAVTDLILTPITQDRAQISNVTLALASSDILTNDSTTASAELSFGTGAKYELYSKSFVKKAFPDYQTISDESYTLTSDNPSVATVSGNTVTGVSAGVANITLNVNLGDCGTYTKTVPVTVHTKVDFYNDLDVIPDSVTNKIAPDKITFKESSRVKVVAEESSSFASHDDRVYQVEGVNVLQLDLGNTNDGSWIARSGSKETKWTIKVPLAKAGWYNLEILRSLWWANANFYVYADDQYAGYYSFTTDKPTDGSTGWKMSEADASNTLYLTPDEEGYVKIMFAFDEDAGYRKARMQLATLTIRAAEIEGDSVTCVDIVHTLPEEMQYGSTAEFEAYALMSDGTRRRINGYKSDATVDASNSIDVSTSDNDLIINRTSDSLRDDGNYEGAITACGVGEKTVKLSVMVDGVLYEETATVNVTAAEEPVAFSMSLAGDGLSYPDKSAPSVWKTKGYAVVLEKTAEYPENRYYTQFDKGVAQIYTKGKHFPDDMSKDSRITFKIAVPHEGYYNIDFSGYKWFANADYSIYINGEYAGDTCCHVPEYVIDGAYTSRALNTLYLPTGDIEISFRMRKLHNYADIFTPKSLDFTPATVSEIAISEVEVNEIPETMEVGDAFDGTARALMNDGLYRSFGFADDGTMPETDIIKVTSSNPDVIEVSNVVCVKQLTEAEKADYSIIIDPTTTTYKLSAKKAGSAKVTVTAIVDGKAKSKTVNITVPYKGAGELVEAATVKFGAFADVGGTVTDVNEVKDVAIGSSVTVSATANDGYEFAYWRNASGKHLSSNAKETFVVNTNTAVIAVFDKIPEENDAEVPVYFYNGNGNLISNKQVTKGTTFADAKIANPSLTGFVFDKWSVADDAIINALTRAVALFNDSEEVYTVKVGGNVVVSGKYGYEVTVTGSENFKAWKLGENIVSYDKKYSFYIWGNVALTEVTEGDVTVAPTVAIDNSDDNYFISYNVPEGYTLIEAGIVFAKSGKPEIGSCNSKAIAKKGTGQFTAKKGEDAETVARGYVMFRDSDENVAVIYAD
ncbi:MAG: hypothetical protein IJO09_05045 [Oscillospiraceae bacterium]|nr:hypothetical protein [Oscillospiraceae bacterium]